MLQYKTLLAESKTPLLLAQKEIASLQKELDGFRKAVDAKAKERDAMERAATFAKAETEKVLRRRPYAIDATLRRRHLTLREASRESRGRVSRRGPKRLEIQKQTTHVHHSRSRRVPSSLGAPRPYL
jgi:capsule polysaccharide export protein KpsE/RkpR